VKHYTSPKYWQAYNRLSVQIRATADKNFNLLKENPNHPSLHLKKVGRFWSVRAGINHRALGVDTPDQDGILWFWIGTHAQYDKLLGRK
jgi:outer membrane phospholipase A